MYEHFSFVNKENIGTFTSMQTDNSLVNKIYHTVLYINFAVSVTPWSSDQRIYTALIYEYLPKINSK